eukprot:Gb_09530 [translate_table: standard]
MQAEPVDMNRHQSGIVPTVQNVVSTVNVKCKLDLKTIAYKARNAEYNPSRFCAVVMRIRTPKTTALVFESGKIVCTGAKTESDSKIAARRYARIIQKLGFQAHFQDFHITNIVASCDVNFVISNELLQANLRPRSIYEPELFPGLIYRVPQSNVALLVFTSGKIVLTGARVREDLYNAFEGIYPHLLRWRRP